MQQYVEYGFIRTKNMIQDGERRARWYTDLGLGPSVGEGWVRKAVRSLSAWRASVRQHLRRLVAGPAQSEQPAG